MWNWLTGKKTYIAAAALAAIAAAGFWFGAINGTQLGEALAVAAGLVGLGHKLDRQIAFAVAALEQARTAKAVEAPKR
jgi:hypothetical protein